MARICLENVSVHFPVYNGGARSFRNELMRAVGSKIKTHHSAVIVEALQDASLTLENGDRLALIGHNGAGKTTMLRTLGGVYPPSSGKVTIEGKVSSLTNFTMGMEPELSGYENITIRLIFMGLTFKEAQELTPKVAEFSELGDYLNLPIRTYSTGMTLRLAFAAATSIVPEILILDEMISAGDSAFIQKARAKTLEFIGCANIMVLASHDFTLLEEYCNKAIWMHQGRIRAIGSLPELRDQYLAQINVT